ncbi:MAG: 50S ribosomal protein L4 [Methanosarcinaceae archaeon]|nr:50S ribosomal protein L4 [Methanosarcinaceae archaeon]
MIKTKVFDLSGNAIDDIELPPVFLESYRPDLIKRAVHSAQAARRQPYGPTLYAGMQTSARGWGSGRGASHVPRIVNSSKAARIPSAVGGRRAHPPKPEKDYTEKINKKERRLAIRSAIAATANEDLVIMRGHIFGGDCFPVVAEDAFENLNKTKDVVAFLKAVGVYDDILRAKHGRKIRAGRGKTRGRKYKHKKSILVVTGSECAAMLAARNLPGVDVSTVYNLNAELLAPGTHAGRLTVWTKSAIEALNRGGFE